MFDKHVKNTERIIEILIYRFKAAHNKKYNELRTESVPNKSDKSIKSVPVADFPIGALGTCLERQICRGGIRRQIFNKFLQKKFFKKNFSKKLFFNYLFTKNMYIQQRIIEEVRRKTV